MINDIHALFTTKLFFLYAIYDLQIFLINYTIKKCEVQLSYLSVTSFRLLSLYKDLIISVLLNYFGRPRRV